MKIFARYHHAIFISKESPDMGRRARIARGNRVGAVTNRNIGRERVVNQPIPDPSNNSEPAPTFEMESSAASPTAAKWLARSMRGTDETIHIVKAVHLNLGDEFSGF